MHSKRIASYPCRIERGAPNWRVSFRDVPLALAGARGVPEVFEAAESALVVALAALGADAGSGLPAASPPAPGEVVITVRLGGPPLVRTAAPPAEPTGEPDASDEDVPVLSGEVVDTPSETGLVVARKQGGFWTRLVGWLTGSRSF